MLVIRWGAGATSDVPRQRACCAACGRNGRATIHRLRLVASRRQAHLTGNAVPPAGIKSALALYSNGAVSL